MVSWIKKLFSPRREVVYTTTELLTLERNNKLIYGLPIDTGCDCSYHVTTKYSDGSTDYGLCVNNKPSK